MRPAGGPPRLQQQQGQEGPQGLVSNTTSKEIKRDSMRIVTHMHQGNQYGAHSSGQSPLAGYRCPHSQMHSPATAGCQPAPTRVVLEGEQVQQAWQQVACRRAAQLDALQVAAGGVLQPLLRLGAGARRGLRREGGKGV